jgi:hypothetical protein
VPPLADTVAVPVLVPSQLGFVLLLIMALRLVAGSVMVVLLLLVHPWLSVTVTVYVPAIRPEVVWSAEPLLQR